MGLFDFLKNAINSKLDPDYDPDLAEYEESRKKKVSMTSVLVEKGGRPYNDDSDKENQYNSGLSYIDYFAKIFREDYSDYSLAIEQGRCQNSTVMVLSKNGSKALVVELLSERSSAYKLRNECMAEGVPYVRFYHDHDGWVNARSYVTSRVNQALGR